MILPGEKYMLEVEGALEFTLHQLNVLEKELLDRPSTELKENIPLSVEDCPQIAPLCRLKVSSQRNHLLRFRSATQVSINQFGVLDFDIELGENILACGLAKHTRIFLNPLNYAKLRIITPLDLSEYNQQDYEKRIKKEYTGKIDKIISADDPSTIIANIRWADSVITDCWGINKINGSHFQAHLSPVAELIVLCASTLTPSIHLIASTWQVGEFPHLEGEPVSLDSFRGGVITESGLWSYPYSEEQ